MTQFVGEVSPILNVYGDELRRLAKKATMRQRHAAIVIDSRTGKILSRGWNRWIRIGSGVRTDSIHAEAHAILRVHPEVDISECDLLVARVMPRDNLGKSDPCNRCSALIERVGIRRVWHS